MIENVILHIGMHSTGTTSFQAFLNENRLNLKSQGFLVYSPVNGGRNAAELSSASRGILAVDDKQEITRNLLAACSSTDCHTLIASAESLSLLSNRNQIRSLRNLFPNTVNNIDAVFVVRDNNVWLNRINENQIYLQNRLHDDSGEPATFGSQIELYKDEFSNLIMLDYERVNMVEKLCLVVGIDTSDCDTSISYHKTTKLKSFLERRFPSVLEFYAKHIAHSRLGRAKRRLANRKLL